MSTAKKTYTVTPANGEAPYEIKAERYEFNETSGRHLFSNGTGDKTEIVANLLNVSVRQEA